MGHAKRRTGDNGYEGRIQAALVGVGNGKYKSFRQAAKEENAVGNSSQQQLGPSASEIYRQSHIQQPPLQQDFSHVGFEPYSSSQQYPSSSQQYGTAPYNPHNFDLQFYNHPN